MADIPEIPKANDKIQGVICVPLYVGGAIHDTTEGFKIAIGFTSKNVNMPPILITIDQAQDLITMVAAAIRKFRTFEEKKPSRN